MAAPELICRIAPHRLGRAKRLARILFGIAASPIVVLYRATGALLPDRRDDVFQGFSQFMSLWPGLPGDYFRLAFYRRTLSRCSPDACIGFGTIFATPAVSIGQNVYIGARCLIAHATIHDDVLIGSNVDIIAGKHQHCFERLDLPIRLQGGRYEPVSIGPDVWIGNGATVMQSVGAHAIVAAGSVVVRVVDEAAIVGGNPARVITHRTHGSTPR
jgi:acetyltransferase-like isoleucine patch superfamily enzyme